MKLSESELIKEMSLLQGAIQEKHFSPAVAEVYILDLIKVDLHPPRIRGEGDLVAKYPSLNFYVLFK